ncbi:MAG: hypothetical protein AAFZ52_08400 [Bacteroidota bacterium]
MDAGVAIALFVSIILPMIALAVVLYAQAKSRSPVTQRIITDRELLELIERQPDQLLSPHQLRDATELNIHQSRGRLNALMMYGLLTRSMSSRGRHYFGLRAPLGANPELDLSPDPFLTVEDLLKIFEHYDYRVTTQELIVATGLPLSVIKREMKHFEKEGIVRLLKKSQGAGTAFQRFFVLQEPYRSDPNLFREKAGVLDLEMREILTNDNLLV